MDFRLVGDRGKGTALSRSFVVVGRRFIESQNVPDKLRRYNDNRIRFNKELVPHFGEKDIGEVTNADIMVLVKKMQLGGKSPFTINQYLIVMRKILKYAAGNRLIQVVLNFPRVKGKGDDQAGLLRTARIRNAGKDHRRDGCGWRKGQGCASHPGIQVLVQFMVNSFILE